MSGEQIQTAPAKPFWESTTLWINLAGVIVIIIQTVVTNNIVVDKDLVAILLAIMNIVNRFRNTSQPLTLR